MSWNDWLHQTVMWSKGQEYMPRWRAIKRFVHEGLIPFVKRHGYVFSVHDNTLMSMIATGLYEHQSEPTMSSYWSYSPYNVQYLEEDHHHWHFILDHAAWEHFWSIWGQWSDVSSESWRGPDRQTDIEAFIWTQIDLEKSYQTTIVNKSLDMDEEQIQESRLPQPSAREDIYIRESAESGEWGGYRR